jgi:hypothetical protein
MRRATQPSNMEAEYPAYGRAILSVCDPASGGPARQYGAGHPAYGIVARAPTSLTKEPLGTGVVICIETRSGPSKTAAGWRLISIRQRWISRHA